MRRNPNHYRRDVREMSIRILAITRDLDVAVAALRDGQPGYPTSSGAAMGPGTLGEDGSPIGLERYIMRRDDAMADLGALDRQLLDCRRQIAQLHELVQRWTPRPEAAADVAPLSEPTCTACERYCPGGPDRLRGGLCNACRMAFTRWRKVHRGTKHDWMTALRRAEWEAAQMEQPA